MVKKSELYPLADNEVAELNAAFSHYCALRGVAVTSNFGDVIRQNVRKPDTGPLQGAVLSVADLIHKWDDVRNDEATRQDMIKLIELGAPLVRYVASDSTH